MSHCEAKHCTFSNKHADVKGRFLGRDLGEIDIDTVGMKN